MKSGDDEILYTARLYLFGVIPLWKVKCIKKSGKDLFFWHIEKIKLLNFSLLKLKRRKRSDTTHAELLSRVF